MFSKIVTELGKVEGEIFQYRCIFDMIKVTKTVVKGETIN